MEIKTLVKANVLNEKIEEQTRILNAIKDPKNRLDIWVNTTDTGEYSLYDLIPEDVRSEIVQVAKSAIEIELKRMVKQFSEL